MKHTYPEIIAMILMGLQAIVLIGMAFLIGVGLIALVKWVLQ